MIFGLGIPELMVILVVVLVIFGPKNLPKLGESLGKTAKAVREGMEDDEEKLDEAKADEVVVEDVPAATDADVAETVPAAVPEEAAAESKFCPACGAENPATNAFCAKCGEKLQ